VFTAYIVFYLFITSIRSHIVFFNWKGYLRCINLLIPALFPQCKLTFYQFYSISFLYLFSVYSISFLIYFQHTIANSFFLIEKIIYFQPKLAISITFYCHIYLVIIYIWIPALLFTIKVELYNLYQFHL
jgi:hypothetical protein